MKNENFIASQHPLLYPQDPPHPGQGGHGGSTVFPILETLGTRKEYTLNRTPVQHTHSHTY